MSLLKTISYTVRKLVQKDPDSFLKKISGVIHVGANAGQERKLYERHNLNVIWVEPIPDVFVKLEKNIKEFPRQKAYQYLLTDKDNETYNFNISNNGGQSSSIFDLKQHRDIWPDVVYSTSIDLQSLTLSSMIKKENIDLAKYEALVMDTQGSELLILKGCGDLLQQFQYIKTEVCDFEAYENCCQLPDLTSFLKSYGFKEIRRHKFAVREEGGAYYNVVYQRVVLRQFFFSFLP